MVCLLDIKKRIQTLCQTQSTPITFWVAFSGGLDSHVLLHVMTQLRRELNIHLRAIHVNHQLHPDANLWSAHCREVCAALQIELMIETIHLNKQTGDSLEEIARQKRYAVIAKSLAANDVLLTAHHADDQAETVLMQLLRGAGIKGLSAMPLQKCFDQGFLLRPFLHLTRDALLSYATSNNLKWINDTSNAEKKFTRNFIRHDVLSVLKSRWPTIASTLSRTAKHFAETQAVLDEYTKTLYDAAQGVSINTLSINKLLMLNEAKQKLVLRYWIEKNNHLFPNTKKLLTILQTMLTANADKNPVVSWETTEVRRYRDELFILNQQKTIDSTLQIHWQLQHVLHVNQFIFTRKNMIGSGLRDDIHEVIIQFRQGGEVLQLNKNTRCTLKHFLQMKGIPPWLRERLPLVFYQQQLICVPGLFIDERYAAEKNAAGFEIHYCEQSELSPCAEIFD